MAIVQGLVAVIGRSAGKVLNTAFGWATMLLFGKVPPDRQIYLSVLAFGSVVWLVVLVGIAFPAVATFLLAFAPLPQWVDRNWVRVVMLVLAVIIPPIVGMVGRQMLGEEDRRKQTTASALVHGYPTTLGLAITLIMLTVVAPLMKVRTLMRRWSSQHVAVMIEPEDYGGVVGEVKQALAAGGWQTERRQASAMLRWPIKAVTALAGSSMSNLVADELTTLVSPKLEVRIYPSDLELRGQEDDVVHARATIAVQLAFSKAHLTWDKAGNEIEDRLRAIWRELRNDRAKQDDVAGKLQAVERDIKKLKVPYDEWEVLFRQKLLVERGLLQVKAGATRPGEPAEAPLERISTQPGNVLDLGGLAGNRPLWSAGAAVLAGGAVLVWQQLRRH